MKKFLTLALVLALLISLALPVTANGDTLESFANKPLRTNTSSADPFAVIDANNCYRAVMLKDYGNHAQNTLVFVFGVSSVNGNMSVVMDSSLHGTFTEDKELVPTRFLKPVTDGIFLSRENQFGQFLSYGLYRTNGECTVRVPKGTYTVNYVSQRGIHLTDGKVLLFSGFPDWMPEFFLEELSPGTLVYVSK